MDKSAKQYAKHFYFVMLVKQNKQIDYKEFFDEDDITYTDHQLSLEVFSHIILSIIFTISNMSGNNRIMKKPSHMLVTL